jgi:hypothetical protein
MTSSWEHGASLYQGRRAIGGHIKVGRGKFEFAPHVLDRKTGGRSLSVDLSSITAVDRSERSWKLSTFSPRQCLIIETSDGLTAKFLVNRLDALVDRLRSAVDEERAR